MQANLKEQIEGLQQQLNRLKEQVAILERSIREVREDLCLTQLQKI